MSAVEVILGAGRLISESETLPRALHVDAWAEGTVLITIENTDSGANMAQMTVTAAELAAFGAIALELAEMGLIDGI